MEFAAPPRNKKRTKAGVLVSEITLEDLQSAFHLPTERACVQLGVGLTILKRLCRKHGITRWPYRSLLKAGKAQRVPNTPSGSSPAVSPRALAPPPAQCTTPNRDAPNPFALPSVSSSSLASVSQSEASNPNGSLAMPAPAALAPQVPADLAAFAAALQLAQQGPLSLPPLPVAPIGIPMPQPMVVEQPQQAQQQGKRDDDLDLLLSAIDACEGQAVEPSSACMAPPTPMDAAHLWAPFTPSSSAGGAPQHPAFCHSARSAFQPVRPVAVRAQPAAGGDLEAKRAELAKRLAALLEVQSQVRALAPSPAVPDAAATVLRALGTQNLDERRRMQLAEKLLLVRAALQARIARKRAALAASAGQRYMPCEPVVLPEPQPDASSPVSIAELPSSGSTILSSLSSTDFRALHDARALLAQYQL